MNKKQLNQPNGLIGLYIHVLKEGKIHNQGQIIGMDGDMCLVQRYSWLSGLPTDVIGIPRVDVYDQSKCKLYSTDEDAVAEWERYCRQRDALATRPHKVNNISPQHSHE
jgi:hypothetical protein